MRARHLLTEAVTSRSKFGSKLFTLGGFEEVTDPKQALPKLKNGWWKTWDMDKPLADSVEHEQPAVRWMQGNTGVPFIDANMAELRESGYVSLSRSVRAPGQSLTR